MDVAAADQLYVGPHTTNQFFSPLNEELIDDDMLIALADAHSESASQQVDEFRGAAIAPLPSLHVTSSNVIEQPQASELGLSPVSPNSNTTTNGSKPASPHPNPTSTAASVPSTAAPIIVDANSKANNSANSSKSAAALFGQFMKSLVPSAPAVPPVRGSRDIPICLDSDDED